MRIFWSVFAVFLCCAGAEPPAYDRYGGSTAVHGKKTGSFHTERICGVWWLITPDGNGFLSKGVCHINWRAERPGSLPSPPADTVEWARATVRQLREWNFNTAGAWSSAEVFQTEFAFTPILDIAASTERDLWLKGKVFDVFSDRFRTSADASAARRCAPNKDNPWLLGYFTDNELRWGADWRVKESVLESYLKLPEDSAGHSKAAEYVAAHGLTEASKDAFLELVAAEYGRVSREAILRHDPNHLILGCRFAGYAPDPVLRGVGKYVDVISYNSYNPKPPVERIDHIAQVTGKPVMVTEFSFKAADSGLPNTKGAGKAVATQQDRADAFDTWVTALARNATCVGFHWFEYRDQPKEGRSLDGENSNFGLIKIEGEPWSILTGRMRTVNRRLEADHEAIGR